MIANNPELAKDKVFTYEIFAAKHTEKPLLGKYICI